MDPTKTIGNDPKSIRLNKILFLKIKNKSFLKQVIIASKDPRCRLISISNDCELSLPNLDSIIKCAEELTGMNSEIP